LYGLYSNVKNFVSFYELTIQTKKMKKKGWRYWRNLLLFAFFSLILSALFLQFIAHPYLTAHGHTHPQRQPVCCQTPTDMGLDYESVSFETIDGLTLHGWYIPSQNHAVIILLHGIAASRVMMLEVAVPLAEAGYGVLLFDLRVHGESEGDVLPYGGLEGEDVRAAVRFLRTRDDLDSSRIGVLGWSLGAQVALVGAAVEPEVKAVVADGPGATAFEDWPKPHTVGEWWYVPYDFVFYLVLPYQSGVRDPMSLRTAVGQIAPRPLLLISGGGIEQHRLTHFYEAAYEPKELWVVPEAGHLGAWNTRQEEYREKIVQFFNKSLLNE
jgi:fermentation-respiration switch protein FrsA (DUF1100 family)